MRVGYVLKVFPRLSETFVLNELLAHERAGAEVTVYSLRPGEIDIVHADLARLRAEVVELPRTGVTFGDVEGLLREAAATLPGWEAALPELRQTTLGEAHQAVALALDARDRELDHLHAHFANVAASVARLAAALAGRPYTVTAHAKDIFHRDVVAEDLSRKFGDAAAVATVSEFNLAYLAELFPASADRLRHVPNGLELDRFPYRDPLDRPPVVAGVGRLVEKKGFDVLVDACALLAARGVALECLIVGGGDREPALREQVEQLGLGDVVRLLGPRPQTEVRRVVQGAAALAAPCVVGADGNRDGLPTVLLEAMALGTPCVSTDVSGIPEVVHDDETGLAVAQRDADALAGALQRLLADARLRVRLAAAARALVERRFDADRNARLLRELFTTTESDADRVLLR